MANDSDDMMMKDLLKKYPKAIIHLRQEKDFGRFGLIFGAGSTRNLGFPTWDVLIENIANNPLVQANYLFPSGKKHVSKSQIIYQYFRSKLQREIEVDNRLNRFDSEVRARWQKIVLTELYKNVPEKIEDICKKDKYLYAYIELIKNIRITINYNFDDTLERMLEKSLVGKDQKTVYKTSWTSEMKLFPNSNIIYHPNGFLPHRLDLRPSPELVFLEDSFADQLIDSMSGYYAFLFNHLVQTTCLLIGLSLSDPNLKHILRQNALRYPGQFHYHIAYKSDDDKLSEEYQKTIRDTNFDTYNLITLFLNDNEIATLGTILNLDEKEFIELAEETGVECRYYYFVTGTVCVGKTTLISQFRSLKTFDEWLETMPEGLEKDPSEVRQEDLKNVIDPWISKQVGKKNTLLEREKVGIYIIDRCPLDAFAFTPKDLWMDKAKLLIKYISPGSSNRTLVPGHIIYLKGDPEVMEVRAIMQHKVTKRELLDNQQNMMSIVYNDNKGITTIDTCQKSITQLTKEIANIIHREEYIPLQIHDKLIKYLRGNNE